MLKLYKEQITDFINKGIKSFYATIDSNCFRTLEEAEINADKLQRQNKDLKSLEVWYCFFDKEMELHTFRVKVSVLG
jgi:hypothetical protein